MLPTKFRIIWPNDYRREEFLKSANEKQESPVVAMFVNGSERNEQYLLRAFHRCFLPSFSSFGWGVLEAYLSVIQCIVSIFKLELSPFPHKKSFFFKKAYNHKHELPVVAMFVNGSGRNEHSL